MAIFLIAYDILNESGTHDYEPLWHDLKDMGAHAAQDSLWLVELDGDENAVEQRLRRLLDRGDRLLIARLRAGEFRQSDSRAGTDEWLAVHSDG